MSRGTQGAVLLLFAAALGCTQTEKVAATYETRGIVRRIGRTENGPEILIHHEDLPRFQDRRGKVVGMESMVMPFGLGSGVPADPVRVGQKVSFTFDVRWGASPMLRITRLEALPPETVLAVDEAK